MRQQLLLWILLCGSILIAYFAANQISYYFSRKETIIGSDLISASAGAVMLEEATLANNSFSGPRVLGSSIEQLQTNNISTVGTVRNESSQFSAVLSESYHGFLFDRYLELNRSPLAGYGQNFVDACRKYGAPNDCTQLLAIAKVETNYCLTDISARQYNCWGFGGSGPNRILYSSFPEAIDEITRRLMMGYGERFFLNANNGGLTYCGAHCVNWGNHVESERRRIANFFVESGYPLF